MRHTLQCIAAAVVATCTLAAQASAADAPANAQASTWQHHETKFTYMGFTASYTCDGIEGKVTQVLKYFGASKPEVRASGCPRGPNSLSRIINVEVKFDTLSAAAAEEFFAASNSGSKPMQGAKIETHVPRRAISSVIAQVVAFDLVAVCLKSIIQARVLANLVAPAKCSLPALADVIVLVNRGIIAKKNEFIRVTAISEGRRGLFS